MLCSVQNCCREAEAPRHMCWAHYKRAIRYGSPRGGRPSYEGDALRWVTEAVAVDVDACLPFPFRGADPYGRVIYEGVSMTAPRAAALMAHGPAEGRFVLHYCKTKSCCNKKHIHWGFHAENMADRRRDDTNLPGSKNPNSKLSEQQVIELRALAGTAPQTALAARFNVTQTTVSSVLRRETWKHI